MIEKRSMRALGMMKSRKCISFLLLLALYVSFISIPNASSQSGVTTTTSTITQPPSGQCTYISIPFMAHKGNGIAGKFGSDASVSFYVLSGDDLSSLQNPDCRLPSTAKPLFSETNVQGHDNSYGTTAFPADGIYYFVIAYTNNGITQLESGHVNVELTYPSSITPVLSGTVQSGASSTASSSSNTIVTSIQSPPQTSSASTAGILPIGTLGIIGVLVAIGLVASVVVFMRARRGQMVIQKEVSPPAPQQEIVQKEKPEPSQPKPLSMGEDNISTGYPELDRVLAGGLPVGYAILMVSPPCDERDLLFRRIIESCLSRESSTFFLSRDLGRTIDFANRYKANFYVISPQADKINVDGSNVFKISSVQNLSDLNISFTKAVETLPKSEANRVIIIDLLSDILLEHKALTTRKWLDDFVAKRKAEGFTILGVLNPTISSKQDIQTIADLFDGIIEIYERELRERARRFLIVKKMYGRKYVDSELMLDKDKLF